MDNLLDKITMDEWEMINTYRQNYVDACCSTSTMLPSKELLQIWAHENQNLYKLLGNNLMVSDVFSYSKSEELMKRELEGLFEGWETCGREQRTGKKFWVAIWNWINSFPTNDYYLAFAPESIDEMVSEEEHNRNVKIKACMSHLLMLSDIANNKYTGESFSITLPNGKEFRINSGCKVMKTLAKIADAFDLPGFEDFRICQSYVTNTRMIRGNLTLSIHPLDYMTMSDNDCDWDSCMSWEGEGCYRQGTVEMMNSPYVVVAYMSAENNMTIGNGEWSNKKWRQLFIVNEDVIFSIKSYPYPNDDITEYAMTWLKQLAEQNMGWSYGQMKPIHWAYDDELMAGGEPFKFSFHTSLMYNDVGSIAYHHMYYNNTKVMPKVYEINFSGDSQCMWCGSLEELREDSLACDSCSGIMVCSDCGERIYDDDVYYIGNDRYCECCYRDYMASCNLCDDNIPREESFILTPYIDDPNNKDTIYITDPALTVCDNCFYEWLKENINEPSAVIYCNANMFNGDPIEYFINLADLSKNGINDLLSYSIRQIYNRTKNLADFITEIKSVTYYSLYSDKRSNHEQVPLGDILTKLEERI